MSYQILSLKVKDISLRYVYIKGGRRTLLVIPGLNVRNVSENAQLLEIAFKQFARDYSIYIFDRRLNMPDDYSIEDMSYDLSLAADALSLHDIHIISNSQGGMIAQTLALSRPELIKKMLLCATTCRVSAASRALFEKWSQLAISGDIALMYRCLYSDWYSPDFSSSISSFIDEEIRKTTAEDLRRFIICTRSMYNFDNSKKLSQIMIPALVIGSRKDKVFSSQDSEELAYRINGDIYIYDEYSHCVIDEDPHFHERTLKFFDTEE